MKFGIQLFGILNQQKTDALEALRQLRDLGYKRIEPCIALEAIPGFESVIWPEAWFRGHLHEIRALGLEIPSAHVFAPDIGTAAGRLRRLAAECGIRQLVVKTPQAITPESLQQAALSYMRAADALAEVGAELLLHNEGGDIAARIDGQTAYERLLALCLGKVGAQVDVGWALAGGEDPVALLRRLGSQVKSLHYKDFRLGGDAPTSVTVGTGDVDTPACFQFARAMGIPQIVDQDEFAGEPMAVLGECLERLNGLGQYRAGSVSYLNTLDVETGEVRTLRRFDRVIEAPNWLKGQNRVLFNSDGHIFSYDLDTGVETRLDTGLCDNCNNDHVVSPDERFLAVSHSAKSEPWASRVYVLPIGSGAPRLVTPNAPSYLHGWSPDGELAYCAFREHGGRMEVDVYAIPAEGGEEVRLTGGGFNDGPEYSPDGRHIWFNSTRSGLMQVWRMNRDGSEPTQMTFTDRNNWFPHVSPDGKKVAWLSYRKGDLEPGEHLPNMQVELWLMDYDGSNPRRAASLFGGQGSINVNSWSPDSRRLAFISYE